MNFDRQIQQCNNHQKQDVEHFHHPKKFPYTTSLQPLLLPAISSPTSDSRQPLICCLLLLDFPLLEFHMYGIMQYIVFFFFLIFWSHCAACRILVPRPGIELMCPALEAQSLNHWTTREVPSIQCFVWLFFFVQHNIFERHSCWCVLQ